MGSNDAVFSQNKQNEPAIAVDAHASSILAVGANDGIDLEACNAGDPTTCPRTPGVGTSGVYFSFDSGQTWTQPTYTGWTARHCVGTPNFTCSPSLGPIGTLPRYFENGLVSGGDPAVAFGPRPGSDGTFSWANGARLYYANLALNLSAEAPAFKGNLAVAMSRTDDVIAAAAGSTSAWMDPVLISTQSSTTFSDKEQLWADNAESSPFFGNVYVCWASFRGQQFRTQQIIVARSTDGGDTWEEKKLTSASNNLQIFGRSGCTIRTDSAGVVYVFYEELGTFALVQPVGTQMMVRSFDGGVRWTRPERVATVVQPGVFEPVLGRPVMDGVAGARVDLAGAPSVDIANGAPTGDDATDEIVMTWSDASDGLNNEHAVFTYSSDGGSTWATPASVEIGDDRPFYVAPAISPDGTDVYVVYNAFLNPYRDNTTAPRSLVGVVMHTDIGANGAPSSWTQIHRGAEGDPRAASTNDLTSEFLGDYVYAVATRTYGAAVWNDARNGADCPAIDAYRMSLRAGPVLATPAPNVVCPATFGNTDIFGGSYADPTP